MVNLSAARLRRPGAWPKARAVTLRKGSIVLTSGRVLRHDERVLAAAATWRERRRSIQPRRNEPKGLRVPRKCRWRSRTVVNVTATPLTNSWMVRPTGEGRAHRSKPMRDDEKPPAVFQPRPASQLSVDSEIVLGWGLNVFGVALTRSACSPCARSMTTLPRPE